MKKFSNYIESFDSANMGWYCSIKSFIINKPNMKNPTTWLTTFFGAYLGFTYGWRIILLPVSVRANIKALMLGFIGSSYALLVCTLVVFFSKEEFFVNADFIARLVLMPVLSFLFAGWIVCGIGAITSLVLYWIAIIFRIMGMMLVRR